MAHCGGREKADVVKLVDTLDLDPSAICLRVRVSPSVRPCFNYVYLIKKLSSALQDSNLQPLISKNNALSN